jgi:hypothetical protein
LTLVISGKISEVGGWGGGQGGCTAGDRNTDIHIRGASSIKRCHAIKRIRHKGHFGWDKIANYDVFGWSSTRREKIDMYSTSSPG